MTAINEEKIKKIGHLAQLEITDSQTISYIKHLLNVLDFIKPIESVDTEGVLPMYQVFDFAFKLREDQITETNQKDLLQSNASCIENDFYLVPKVIDICEIKN